jgi:Archaea-specific editing domain of threonyl-tRNA synthetase
MRLLIWHVDAFAAEPTERGRSKLADAAPAAVRLEDGLVVFAACEKADEAEPEAVAGRAAAAIAEVAKQLGARSVVLHSFAHLFVELSAPAAAKAILDATQARLEAEGYSVGQSAFGWFNRLDLRAKGHPLSRVARQV